MSDNPLDELTSMSSDEPLASKKQEADTQAASKPIVADESGEKATRPPQRLVTERVSGSHEEKQGVEAQQKLEPVPSEVVSEEANENQQPLESVTPESKEPEKAQQPVTPRIPSKDPKKAQKSVRVPSKQSGMKTEVVSRDAPPVPTKRGNGFKWLVLAGVFLILGLLLVVGYLVWQLQQQEQQVRGPQPLSTPVVQAPAPTVAPTATPQAEPQAVVGWQEYASEELGVQFSYPPGFDALECETGVKLLEATASATAAEPCDTEPLGVMQVSVESSPLGVPYGPDDEDFTVLTDTIAVGGETGEYLMVQKTGEVEGPDYQEFVTVEYGEQFYRFWLRSDEYLDEFEQLLESVGFE